MRFLVATASRYGSTTEIGATIAEVLAAAGHDITRSDCEDDVDPADFDAVVIGSAVYAGHWLRPAKTLITTHGDALCSRPVWLFSSGPVGDPPKPDEDPVDAEELVATSGARGHEVFAGKLDRTALRFTDKAIASALRAPAGDFRNWETIRSWAAAIAGAAHANGVTDA